MSYKPGYFHTKSLSKTHIGKQKSVHVGKVNVTTKFCGKTHTGHKGSVHDGEKIEYHPGKLKKASVDRVTAFIFTLSLSEWAIWKSEEWQWYDCCNQYIGEAGIGCHKRWSCCDRDESNLTCTGPESWSCCDDSTASIFRGTVRR